MILTKGLLKLFGRAMVLGALLLVFGRCGSSDDGTPANISAVFMETETTTLDAKGYATDPRLVLTGPVGTAYTVTVTRRQLVLDVAQDASHDQIGETRFGERCRVPLPGR